MIQRIKSITALADYFLDVTFDDGKHVIYDVKEVYCNNDEDAGLTDQNYCRKIGMENQNF